MSRPEFFGREAAKQVVERFTKATGITDRIVGYDESWRRHSLATNTTESTKGLSVMFTRVNL